ncbi:hypothetical protein [Aeoliella mucimassa]|uniref:TIGR04255 family protein n=1 Tax=Aeoliella mucimassa TaxID=2527972 RepID=A0A518AN54_9BACT|nr:hypothetical protein [Aeoliella mucimassa]QDU56154.1 hypothetical protein Pan181_23580 [Aeoliella mucimassa]
MTTQPQDQLNQWLTLEMQMTVFHKDAQHDLHHERASDWFQRIAGDEFSSTRKTLVRTDEAKVDNKHYSLTNDPLKVTWNVSAVPDVTNGSIDELPSLGSFEQASQEFHDTLGWFLDECPEITRIGFVPRLVYKTDSKEETYKFLDTCLKDIKVDPSSQEFQYRINRPRKSDVIAGLAINRLSTWTAAKFAIRAVSGDQTQNQPVISHTHYGCVLQLDINTDADRKESIEHESLHKLWDELAKMAAEIVHEGDIQ